MNPDDRPERGDAQLPIVLAASIVLLFILLCFIWAAVGARP